MRRLVIVRENRPRYGRVRTAAPPSSYKASRTKNRKHRNPEGLSARTAENSSRAPGAGRLADDRYPEAGLRPVLSGVHSP
jgi:hypothetical protein